VARARVVICPVWGGVLKHGGGRGGFTAPPLPRGKAAAIGRLGMGRVEKVHLEYDSYWWRGLGKEYLNGAPGCARRVPGARRRCGGVVFLWDAAHARAAATGTVGSASARRPFDGWEPWMGEGFGAYEDRDPVEPTRPILTFWFCGAAAAAVDPPHLAAAGPPQVPAHGASAAATAPAVAHRAADACTKLLRYFLLGDGGGGGGGAGTSHAAHLRDVPRPKRVLMSRWGSDPLFLGSYTYVATGTSVDDIHSLAAPLYVGDATGGAWSAESLLRATGRLPRRVAALLFAGEATHPSFFSCTHAAFHTGIEKGRAAVTMLGRTLATPPASPTA